MNKKNNIVQRAQDFDLTEQELKALYSDPNQLTQVYDGALIDNITENLFIPGHTALLDERRAIIESLTKSVRPDTRKVFAFPMRLVGIAASSIILIGAFFLLRPQSGELSEKQITEFKEISRSTYSPHVIASLERSTVDIEHKALVTAYVNKDYSFILDTTIGELNNAELSLLRARVLMDLERYKEAFEIMKSINEEELIQKDVYLWMMAEGALGVGDEIHFHQHNIWSIH